MGMRTTHCNVQSRKVLFRHRSEFNDFSAGDFDYPTGNTNYPQHRRTVPSEDPIRDRFGAGSGAVSTIP
jgi:hypothetical protein